MTLKYHSVPAENLAKLTIRRLKESGVPHYALGTVLNGRVTLQGVVAPALCARARASLPPALGGGAEVFETSALTRSLLERAVPKSPQRGESLGLRTPPRRTSQEGSPTPRGTPSSAEKVRLLREIATVSERAEALAASVAEAEAAASAALASRTALRRSVRTASSRASASASAEGGTSSTRAALTAATEEAPGPTDAEAPSPEALLEADSAVQETARQLDSDSGALHAVQGRLADMEAAYSALGGGATPSSRGGGSLAGDQRELVAASDMATQVADAVAYLTEHAASYPLVARAMRLRGAGTGVEPAVLEDFDALVLVRAVQAARTQAHGLALLRKGARDTASLAGSDGTCAMVDFEPGSFVHRYGQTRLGREIRCIFLRPSPSSLIAQS